jgi:transposase
MDFVGIDLHKTSSQVCILSEGGELTERRIKTTRASFDEMFAGSRPRARILVEASTKSEWVACHLEALGHEVIVADPNFAPMYATRDKKIKTDKRDARRYAKPAASAPTAPLTAPPSVSARSERNSSSGQHSCVPARSTSR